MPLPPGRLRTMPRFLLAVVLAAFAAPITPLTAQSGSPWDSYRPGPTRGAADARAAGRVADTETPPHPTHPRTPNTPDGPALLGGTSLASSPRRPGPEFPRGGSPVARTGENTMALDSLPSALPIRPVSPWASSELPRAGPPSGRIGKNAPTLDSSAGARPALVLLAAPEGVSVPPEETTPAGTIRIGLIGPMSGPLEAHGLSSRRGALLALELARSGAAGFELVVEDDRGDSIFSAAATARLADDPSVVAILGALAFAPREASRVAASAGCAEVRPMPADSALARSADRAVLANLSQDVSEGALLARYLFDARGCSRLALLHDDTVYGRGGARLLAAEAASREKPFVLEREFAPGAQNVAALAEQVAASRADGVVVWARAEDAARLCKALSARGVRAAIAGPSALANPVFADRAGAAAEGVVLPYPADASEREARARAFRSRFRSVYGQEPDSLAADSFAAAERIVGAVREVGVDRRRVREQLARGLSPAPAGPLVLAAFRNGRPRALDSRDLARP